MQIVLVGQPQLARRLAKPSMVQLRQRLSMIIRLEPLNFEEVRNYINHRLSAAGYDGPSLFTLAARRLIAERSQGIPRNINTICFNAMALACAMKLSTIDHNVVLEVLADLDLNSLQGETVISHATELKRMLLQASATKKEMPLQAPATKKEKAGLRGVWSKFAAAGLLLALVLGLPFSLNNRESQTAATANLSGASAPVSLNTASPSAVPFHEHEVAPVETVADRQVDRP